MLSSVQRYTKEFRLSRQLAGTPTIVTEAGVRFAASPRDVWVKAIQRSPAAGSFLAKVIEKALRSRTTLLAAGAPALKVFGVEDEPQQPRLRQATSNRDPSGIARGS